MQLLAFWLRHPGRISRPAEPGDITVEAIGALRQLKEREKTFMKPSDKPKIDHKDWIKMMESIQEYLAQCPGLTKSPLAATDPPINYTSHQAKMIWRTPHGTDTFREDREQVFLRMREICENNPAYVYMKPAVKPWNGRVAFHLLYQHYLGKSAVDQLITKAEAKLSTLAYSGKDSRHWTFKTHVSQHALIDTLISRGLYLSIDDTSKVRYLLTGLKDPCVEAVKSQILTLSDLQQDFDAAVRLCQDSLTLQGAQRTQLNISAITTSTSDMWKIIIMVKLSTVPCPPNKRKPSKLFMRRGRKATAIKGGIERRRAAIRMSPLPRSSRSQCCNGSWYWNCNSRPSATDLMAMQLVINYLTMNQKCP